MERNHSERHCPAISFVLDRAECSLLRFNASSVRDDMAVNILREMYASTLKVKLLTAIKP